MMIHHGGRRQGAGRPRKKREYSDKFKKSVQRALEKKAKETGKSIFDVFADQLYNVDKKQPQVWSANFKTLVEIIVVKESHQTNENKTIGPAIGLPPIREPDIAEGGIPIIKLSGKEGGYKQ